MFIFYFFTNISF